MDNQIDLEISKLEEIKNRIKTFEDLDHASKVTLERGRLIDQTKKVIKLLENKQDKTDDDIKLLDQYYTMLSQTTFTHKRQISERYKKEFIHGEAKVPDVITTLPKAMGLQVNKIATTVNEIKYARGSKAKAAAATNFAKETGLLVATPVIFAGKFLIEHWYLLLLLWGLDREKKRKKKPKDKPEEQKQPNENVAAEPAQDLAADRTEVPKELEETGNGPIVLPNPNEEPVEKPQQEPGGQPNEEPVPQEDPGLEPGDEPGKVIQFPGTEPEYEPQEEPGEDIPAAAIDRDPAVIPQYSFEIPTLTNEQTQTVTALNDGFVSSEESAWANEIGQYGYFIEDQHQGVTVIHNAEEWKDFAMTESQRASGIDVWELTGTTPHDDYASASARNTIPALNRNFLWPEVETELGHIKGYFPTTKEFLEYVYSGQDASLTRSYIEYVQSNCDVNYLYSMSRNFPVIQEMCHELGIDDPKTMAAMAVLVIGSYMTAGSVEASPEQAQSLVETLRNIFSTAPVPAM